MPQGAISFGGVNDPQYLIATRTTGAKPDVAVLYATPQPGSPDVSGTATLSFIFNGVTVNWTNCLCDRGTLQITPAGHRQVFEILDSRWRWSRSYWTGAYNIRQPDGSIDSTTQRTLAQVAFDLFSGMGVVADLSQVSTTYFPEVVYDRDNCADAIEALLNPLGYVISLNVDDTVTVNVRGKGATLPANGDVVSVNFVLNPPKFPLFLTACGKWTLVQSKLATQPVGLDTDGSIQPVNSLSYTPAGGWSGTDLEAFNQIANPVAKDLAIRSVGKWYQVINQADGTFNINNGGTNYCPGQIVVSTAFQYLPLSTALLTAELDPFGKERDGEAYVEGTFFDGDVQANPPKGSNTAAFTRIDKRDWTLDKELGIVRFKDPALKVSGGLRVGTVTFADVYFNCSYAIHDNLSHVKDRFIRSQNLGGIGEVLMKLDQLERHIIVNYTPGSSAVSSITDNLSTMNSQADLFLNQAALAYSGSNGNVILYRGIYPFSVDGVNLQVRWDVNVPGSVPFGTHVSQYCEGLPLLPTMRERSLTRNNRMNGNADNRRVRQFQNGRKNLKRKGPH